MAVSLTDAVVASFGGTGLSTSHEAVETFLTTYNANLAAITLALANGAIGTDQLAALSVTTAKIALDAIDGTLIADDAIDSEHYAALSIDTEHIALDAIDGTLIADDAIDSEHYAALSIDTEHIALDAIDGTLIADDAIDSEHYAALSIDTEHIALDAIDGTLIADDAIDSEHYAALSIDTEHIALDAIDGTLIADDAIDSEHYAAVSIDTEHIALDAIDGTLIADDAIDSEHYATGSIDCLHMAETSKPLVMLQFSRDCADIADGDLLTDYIPGFAGKIISAKAFFDKAVTTGAKASTLNLEIETTDVTGGVLALSGTYALGEYVDGTAITADNEFTATEKISVEASSTTAFVEGRVTVCILLQQADA